MIRLAGKAVRTYEKTRLTQYKSFVILITGSVSLILFITILCSYDPKYLYETKPKTVKTTDKDPNASVRRRGNYLGSFDSFIIGIKVPIPSKA